MVASGNKKVDRMQFAELNTDFLGGTIRSFSNILNARNENEMQLYSHRP